ncbi:sigma-54-dependent Fis family transcriptional regulator [Desulfonatronum thioautotrophicum]|uniref:sigma-54-dependent Fis family transcriptional regulator n=1 Tax=Desulfonatronum thioautotrophicum TaxID=617001 RepID=UPI0005EAF20B|nr:sigma-54-dependent Fis family transcriptional regulator [Desulfonatronum thioautotrophicum]
MQKNKTQHIVVSHVLSKELVMELSRTTSRSTFLQSLSRLLQQQFDFDRLCINLYDPNSEMLSYFSAAEGTMVNSLSPVRKAEKSTVAGHVIATRKPVVITDIAQHFPESTLHPMAEAGLTTTMAFPLVLNDEILGTLHCSFVHKPDNLYAIMELFLELCPYVAVCLGALLGLEHLEQGGTVPPLHASCPLPEAHETFIFESPKMRRFMSMVNKIARLDMPVLLLGETGTGKTHLARYIHATGKRSKQNFVRVNCPALSTSLFESEIFGHAKGAFTGASTKRVGRIELAHDGTLFLDEIAELSQEMQSKLLHVLDEQCFERVGESVSLSVDVRLVTATNVDIQQAMAQGKLRRDFYYRLSACTLELPPLRDRPEDIPVMAGFFINQLCAQHGLPKPAMITKLTDCLQDHSWPGNIRELRNALSKILLRNCIAGELTTEDIRDILRKEGDGIQKLESLAPTNGEAACENDSSRMPQQPARSASNGPGRLEDLERQHILETLRRTHGVISGPKGAAALLGLPRSTLQHRMRKLGIDGKRRYSDATMPYGWGTAK